MNRVSKAASIFGAATIALSLTACGGDSSEYCDEIESVQSDFSNMEESMSSPDDMSGMADSIQSIADAAPDDVQEDWNTLAEALSTISDLDMEDPESMQDPEVAEQMEELGNMDSTVSDLNDQVQDECDIDLQEAGS